MKLPKLSQLIFKKIHAQNKKYTKLAETLGIYPQNITMWEEDMNIPIKHVAVLKEELGITKRELFGALKADFDDTLNA
jgi:hypothetical protein